MIPGSRIPLRLNDVFWTFQGEGRNWGRRALFVRLPFCNLACAWCDTEYNSYKSWEEDQFEEFAKQESCRFAVVTGGEPTVNKQVKRVIELLKGLGFEIAMESNGTFPIPAGVDFATVSPKRDAGYEVHAENLKFGAVHEFKFVVDEGFDWAVLKSFEGSDAILSLSPEFNRFEKSLEEIFAYIKENPKWRISLQTHKWMKVQ